MPYKREDALGINSWLKDEQRLRYSHDPGEVDESWKRAFESESRTLIESAPVDSPSVSATRPEEEWIPLRGTAQRVAENMMASLTIPVATSQRTIPVKLIEENRRIINQHRTLLGKSKVSYTHLIAWAVLKALQKHSVLNQAYAENNGEAFRIVRRVINFGVAVDLPGKQGSRSLVVPNIKNAGALNFQEFLTAYDDLVSRARANSLKPEDFQETTITLTNPGTVGTVGSVPRLMPGQGAIIATGVIDYPAEYHGAAREVLSALGIGKVMTITCTYDHRIIQGAESGMFLGKVHALLQGEDNFYEQLFADLKLPYSPVQWESDRAVSLPCLGGVGPSAEVAKEAAVLQLINAYRVRGHLIANLDPLGSEPGYHPELDPITYGLTIWDLDRKFLTGSLADAMGQEAPQPVATLREILETLRRAYCGKVGCEYMNIQHPEQKRWLQLHLEPETAHQPLPPATRIRILEQLVQAEEFEHFLHSRFVGHKRFSIEGAETAIPILDELLNQAAAGGVQEVVIGMAHRGRLNVLANIVGKSLVQIFSEFEGYPDPASTQGTGDVKYHLGATGVRHTPSGQQITVSVSPNASHLEAVDPVVEGVVRAKQERIGDTQRDRVIPVLIHGDAAFAGQGVVAETLNLSQLHGYRTGGTIHLVINNQIGFTTPPGEARSSPYSTDVARGVQAPIFHVNGDDPEAAIRVARLAFEYRQQFKKDVVIDMFCYRRHGHNEADDPSYTQPILYRKIKDHPSVAVLYAGLLIREGVITQEDVKRLRRRAADRLGPAYEQSQKDAQHYEFQELSVFLPEELSVLLPQTAANRELLQRVARGITSFPKGFHLHPKLNAFVDRRKRWLEAGGVIDWAFAETLAFGTMLFEGTPVRLSGQDSSRGTFSQRHLVFSDYETGQEYCPLQHLDGAQGRFEVYDSSLSEYAVLGFEFGYCVADPLTLVIWEAQFGDFANGAQIMIDQFISCSESKWSQPNGLVLLLPHGYEGQGPEHSSARVERFLTLCAGGNMQVANCTTPAQYFHLLRRQTYGGTDRRGVRKPLVIFTPKSLLRHPQVVSPVEDFTSGAFQEVFDDPGPVEPDNVSRILLCSGKIFYELLAERQERGVADVAIVRVEQLYPFPDSTLEGIFQRYPKHREVIWVQEEPRNMGAWRFVRAWINHPLEYVGRPESASPATGSYRRHLKEQAAILEMAFERRGR